MIFASLRGPPADIYSATFSIFLVNRFLGTAPFGMREHPSRCYEYKRLPMVSSALKVLAIFVGTICNIVYTDNRLPFQIHLIMNIYFGFLSISFIVCACIRARSIIAAFKMINDVDEKLKTLGIWMSYRTVRRSINVHMLTILGFAVLIVIIQYELGNSVSWLNINFFLQFIPQFMILSVELQYYHYLRLAKDRYRILNEYLEALEREKDTFFELSKPLGARQLSAATLKATRRTCDPVFVLQTISELHIQLTDMCAQFEKAFCVQLLCRITLSALTITISLFYFFVDLGKEFNYMRQSLYLLSVIFVMVASFCVLELFALAWISDSTCREANSCALYLHKLKHKCKGDLLQDLIELYSVQMYHNKLQFTVCGLFPLDHTLLYSMTGAVTTYLIFLVQFNKMADKARPDPETDNATAPGWQGN